MHRSKPAHGPHHSRPASYNMRDIVHSTQTNTHTIRPSACFHNPQNPHPTRKDTPAQHLPAAARGAALAAAAECDAAAADTLRSLSKRLRAAESRAADADADAREQRRALRALTLRVKQ
eukprot:141238-Chlamydomonas_euryale.AAC.3